VVRILLKFGDGVLGIMTVVQYLKYSSDSDSDQHEQTTEVMKLLK